MSDASHSRAAGSPSGPTQETGDCGRFAKSVLALVIVLGLAGAAYQSLTFQIDPDELEHLHATWLWRQGLEPFTGFFEHHPPLYWVVLRPILWSVHDKDLAALVIRARLFSWLMAAGAVVSCWWFFTALFGRKAAWGGTAFFAAYAAVSPHVTSIRPDVPSLLLLVVGSTLAINGLGVGQGRRELAPWRVLLAGVLLATACCILTKGVFWVAFLLAGISAWVLWELRRGRGGRHLLPLGLLIAGAAVPLALQLAWIFIWSDLRTFWYCNVEVNRTLVGSVSKNLQAVYYSWRELWGWPMVSTPLAAVGLGHFLAIRDPSAGIRKVVTCLLTVSGIVLILLGNGPWPQYHIPLLLMLAGLAGLGLAVALEHCQARAQQISMSALGGLSLVWIFILLLCRPGATDSQLRQSLAGLEQVLTMSRPGDTYATVQHWNPVFMMDADPKTFMKLVCLHDAGTFDEFRRTVAARRPRFILGLGSNVWMAEGKPSRLQLVMSERDAVMVWLTQEGASVVRLSETFLGPYRPLDSQGFVLERQE